MSNLIHLIKDYDLEMIVPILILLGGCYAWRAERAVEWQDVEDIEHDGIF